MEKNMSDEPSTVDELVEMMRAEVEATGGTITSGGEPYAVVGPDGIVGNMIVYSPDNEYDPGEGNTLLRIGDSEVGIGDKVDKAGKILVKYVPAPTEPEETSDAV